MKKRLILLLMVLLLAVPAAAQTDPQYRYANVYVGDETQLVAYTLAGETLVVAAGITSRATGILRGADPNTGIMTIEIADEADLYWVTPTGIRLLFDAPVGDWAFVLAHDAERAVLAFADRGVTRLALIDLRDGAAQWLPGYMGWIPDPEAAVLTAAAVRYLAFEDDNDWSLYEHVFATDQTRIAHELSTHDGSPDVRLKPDTTGALWLGVERGEDLAHFYTYTLDGDRDLLPQDTETRRGWRLLGDDLYPVELGCEAECRIVFPYTDDPAYYYVPPGGALELLRRVDDRHLLAMVRARDFYLITAEEEPRYLGEFNPQRMLPGSQPLFSPDGRWVTTYVPDDDAFRLWDLHSATIVYEHTTAERGFLDQVRYEADRVELIFSEGSSFPMVIFDIATSAITTTPVLDDQPRRYFEVLPDDTVLYAAMRVDWGIYRYDPASGESRPIMLTESWMEPVTLPKP